MTRRYRIVNKCRFTVFVVIMLLLLTTVINFALGFNDAQSLTRVDYLDVEVSAGDTLWSIAQTYMADTPDIREAVDELCKINQINASQLYAGMTIQVPQMAS